MDKITTISIDLAKHVFQVAAENAQGEELWQQRLHSRDEFMTFMQGFAPPLVVLMEAGLGAQAWARWMQARGLTVRVLPAQRVAEHRSGSKNDRHDASAGLRAGRDRSIHAVPIKSVEQLTMQALHRVRSGYVRRRTALSNQMRGLLLEHAIVIGQGDRALIERMNGVLESASYPIPDRLRELMGDLFAEWGHLTERMHAMEREFALLARVDPTAQQIDTIPGVGPMTATALACKGLNPDHFANARRFAAHFGTVPEQHSSGNKRRLGRMTCRGDRYIRMLVINGAHAVLRRVRADATDPDSRRLQRWKSRHGSKGAAVRLANRNLRIVWALLKRNTTFHRTQEAAMVKP